MPKPYFRSNYAEVKTQFEPPFDNCVCIPLTKGQHALIDVEDFEVVQLWSWSSSDPKKNYAVRGSESNGARILVRMHRLIARTPDDMQVDHINGNGFDNRKRNLRNCTHWQNHANKHTKRELKGVYFDKKRGVWAARIGVNYKQIQSKYYQKKEDAAKAYDHMAIKYFGEFAQLNFPNITEPKQ